MSKKSRKPLLIAAALLLVLLLVPWTRRKVRTEITLGPVAEAHLEAPEDAVVSEVLAGEGDAVIAGQPVFRLSSPSVQSQSFVDRAALSRFEKAASLARGSSEPAAAFAAERQGASAASAMADDAARQERLVVRSPIAGTILTPRVGDLRGQFVPSGTLLADVGDCRRLRADLDFTERRLDEIAPGEAVSAMLPGRPLRSAKGTIVSVSPATLAQPVTSRASMEPPAPTERPDRFVARAVFENADGTLRPGMSGKAQIYSQRSSLLGGTWRVLRRWLQTVIW